MTINKIIVPKKRLGQIWAQVPVDYYDQGIAKNPLQRLWHTQKLKQVIKLLPRNSKNILDVGCSSAVLTLEIAKNLPKSKITGIDIYKKAIDFAKIKYPNIELLVADVHNLPFEDKVFDLIICTELLEHVTDPAGALREIRRVLRKNGSVIISMDTGSFLFRIVWYFWTMTKGRVWQNAHLHKFNTELLEDLISKVGFKITKKVYSHVGMAVTFLLSK